MESGPERFPKSVGIKALDRDGIGRLVDEFGEPSFRVGQIVRWLYQRSVRSYDEMSDLPAHMRQRLSESLALPRPEVVAAQRSVDGTRKYLLRLADGVTVETVGLPADDRLTVCFSTQAGCAMGCSFCATGRSGLVRSLGPGEMADQVAVVAADFGYRVTNVVAMGQGEPFANYDAVLGALRFINSPDGFGVGARHITVSTCGLLAGIRRFAEEPEQFTLAVSLHSAVQKTRDQLMPGVRGIPLGDLRAALVDYAERTGRRPSLEYALVAGINDSDDELRALVQYCHGMLAHVNVIPINPVEGSAFHSTGPKRAASFVANLEAAGVAASLRTERGADIDAACGQLRQREAEGPGVR
jgi:23S rRNA (adenine2503-C2)-methyltransferase